LRLDHNLSSRDSLSTVYTIDDGNDITENVPVVEFETPIQPVFPHMKFTNSWIQGQEQVVAATVQRQLVDLPLSDQPRDVPELSHSLPEHLL
jgi:hypothetical protein